MFTPLSAWLSHVTDAPGRWLCSEMQLIRNWLCNMQKICIIVHLHTRNIFMCSFFICVLLCVNLIDAYESVWFCESFFFRFSHLFREVPDICLNLYLIFLLILVLERISLLILIVYFIGYIVLPFLSLIFRCVSL